MLELLNTRLAEQETAYNSVDCILYALSLGFGEQPTDPRQLRYVYEEHLSSLPTLPLVLGWPGLWMPVPGRKLDYARMLHAEEQLELHRPLPAAGMVRDETFLDAIVDRGRDKGAFAYTRKELYSENDGLHLATIRSCILARGDGGCGNGGTAPPPLAGTPTRPPELEVTRSTRPVQALLYRLNGDSNPVHAEPAAAKVAGFERPLLHGRCTLGLAVHDIMAHCCGYRADAVRGVAARFAAPFYPGETLRVRIWREWRKVHFAADCLERGVTVLSHGLLELRN